MKHQPVMDDSNRKPRLAMLLAWRTLRQSVIRGRPMSLPNLLRLHQRLAHDVDAPQDVWLQHESVLRRRYMAAQPFDFAAPPRHFASTIALPPTHGGGAMHA